MNRWVLLKHVVFIGKTEDIHYDFLIEDKVDCLTWKFYEIPLLNKDEVGIIRQSNHRLIWLSRKKHKLSRNRGMVTRIDQGTYVKNAQNKDHKKIKLILNGKILNGFFEISGQFCRLTKNT